MWYGIMPKLPKRISAGKIAKHSGLHNKVFVARVNVSSPAINKGPVEIKLIGIEHGQVGLRPKTGQIVAKELSGKEA